MPVLTIRGLDQETAKALKRAAQQKGLSVNGFVVGIIRESLGVDARKKRRFTDLDRFAAELKSISRRDAGFIDDFISAAQAFRSMSFIAGLDKPPELTHFWDTAKMMLSMGKKFKYYIGQYNLPIGRDL